MVVLEVITFSTFNTKLFCHEAQQSEDLEETLSSEETLCFMSLITGNWLFCAMELCGAGKLLFMEALQLFSWIPDSPDRSHVSLSVVAMSDRFKIIFTGSSYKVKTLNLKLIKQRHM